MMIGYDDQNVMYDDIQEMLAPHDTTSLDNTPTTHSRLKLDSATTAKYNEDTNPQIDLAQLQKLFQQLQERLNQLGPTTNPPTHTEGLAHLTKLAQLTKYNGYLWCCSHAHPAGLWKNPHIQQCRSTLTPCALHSDKRASQLYCKTSPHLMDGTPWS